MKNYFVCYVRGSEVMFTTDQLQYTTVIIDTSDVIDGWQIIEKIRDEISSYKIRIISISELTW